MKVTVKTLQGKSFSVQAEENDTILSIKEKIVESQSSLASSVDVQKLIHSGKVLENSATLASSNVTEASFLVCMITKPKPAPRNNTSTSAASSTPAPTTSSSSTTTPAASTTTLASSSTTTTSSTPAPATSTTSTLATSTSTPAPSTTSTPAVADAAAVSQLCDMGFPEEQVRAALAAAFQNADRAVEYLMNGIPENIPAPAPPSTNTTTTPPTATGGGPGLEALRQHPQFDSLRTLVQSNPAALPQVLQQIGAQSPQLLAAIHANQAQFIQMMNEPVTATPSSTTTASSAAPGQDASGANQVAQMLASLTPEQSAAMAAQMGMTPEQLQAVSSMVSSLPPEALAQMLQAGGAGGLPGAAGGAPLPGGQTTISLTQEEAAAVDRLCAMGFERNDVLQAYLACEKNEGLAANFLMDSMMNDN